MKDKIARLIFILFIPLYFYYNIAVTFEIIPPFLGGYTVYIGILGIFIFMIAFVKKAQLSRFDIIEQLFLLLQGYIFIIALFYLVIGIPKGYSIDMFKGSMTGIGYNMLLYWVAKYLRYNKGFIIKISMLFLGLLVLILANIDKYDMLNLHGMASDHVKQYISTYQGFARSLMFMSFIMVAYYFNNFWKLFIVFFLGVIALFFNGARTELVLFILGVLVLFIVKIQNIRVVKIVMISLLGGILALPIVFSKLENSRIMELGNLSKSSSWLSRQEIQEYAVASIKQSPIWGDYGAYAIRFGDVGSYSHNLLSAWQDFGVIGFAMYILILIIIWLKIFKFLLKKQIDTIVFRLCLMFLISLTVAFVFSKNHSYMILGFTVGLMTYCNNCYSKKIFKE